LATRKKREEHDIVPSSSRTKDWKLQATKERKFTRESQSTVRQHCRKTEISEEVFVNGMTRKSDFSGRRGSSKKLLTFEHDHRLDVKVGGGSTGGDPVVRDSGGMKNRSPRRKHEWETTFGRGWAGKINLGTLR